MLLHVTQPNPPLHPLPAPNPLSTTLQAFLAARARYHQITLLVEMALAGSADLPCFTKHGPREAVRELTHRFRPDLRTHFDVARFVNTLVDDSLANWTTRCYDKYQRCCVGIF